MSIEELLKGYVAKEEIYADKAVIVEEGAKGIWAYAILEGRAKVKKRTAKGMVTLDILEKGAVFGEMALFSKEKGQGIRSASVIAAHGPVKVAVLDSHRLIQDFEALSPRFQAIVASTVGSLKAVTDKVCTLTLSSK